MYFYRFISGEFLNDVLCYNFAEMRIPPPPSDGSLAPTLTLSSPRTEVDQMLGGNCREMFATRCRCLPICSLCPLSFPQTSPSLLPSPLPFRCSMLTDFHVFFLPPPRQIFHILLQWCKISLSFSFLPSFLPSLLPFSLSLSFFLPFFLSLFLSIQDSHKGARAPSTLPLLSQVH